MLTPEKIKWLREAADAAVSVEHVTGCPAELIVAQSLLESGCGKSAAGNNALGIKWYPGAFGRQLWPTSEWFSDARAANFRALGDGRTIELSEPVQTMNGKTLYRVRDWFAVFPDLRSCFMKRAERFNAGRNLPFVKAFFAPGGRDFALLFQGVARSGYQTDDPVGYASALLAIIRRPEVVDALDAARNEKEIA